MLAFKPVMLLEVAIAAVVIVQEVSLFVLYSNTYPVLATLEIAQDTVAPVAVIADDIKLVGALQVEVVVKDTGLLATDRLPAASFAFTVKVYAVASNKPVTAKVVLVVDPNKAVPL